MDYKNFASTWLSLHASNRFLKIVCLFLMTLNLVALIGWLKKDNIVILVPPSLSEKSEIAKNTAAEGYKKAWGMYAATLLGNVTPENADFVLDSFANMVTGEIRALVIEQIAAELETLKQEKVSSSFEIRRVTYEPESDKVFVSGRNRMAGLGVHTPIITQMATYEGAPKLLKMVEQVEAKQKAEATLEKDQKK